MDIMARIAGGILLLAWIYSTAVARRVMAEQGRLVGASVFQLNSLPFIAGMGLILTGNLWVLIALPLAWVLSTSFTSFFLFWFPPLFGAVLGALYADSRGWSGAVGVIIGVAVMALASLLVTALVSPQRSRWGTDKDGLVVLTAVPKCTKRAGKKPGPFRDR